MLVKEPLDLGHVPKIEEVGFGYGPKVGRLEAPKEALERVDSLWIEQPTWPKETSLLKSEALPKQIPLVEISLPNAEKQPKSEPAHRKVLAPKRTPVKKELPPKQMLMPSPPLLQSTTLPRDTLSSQETKPSPSTRTEDTSAVHIITNYDTNITVFDNSSNPKMNSSVLPSATLSEDIPQTNTHTSTDTSSTTNSPPLNFSDPSEPDPSDSLATSASPDQFRAGIRSPTPLVTEISEALLSLSTDEQEEIAKTLTLITQSQWNVGGDGKAEPESELLGCDGQTRVEEVKSHGQDESTATETKRGRERMSGIQKQR